MTTNKAQHGTPFSVTATHATAAVATKDAATGVRHFVTSVSASSDKAGSIVLVKSGTTTLWQSQVGATFYNMNFDIPLGGVNGELVSVEIDGTTVCNANIGGYSI